MVNHLAQSIAGTATKSFYSQCGIQVSAMFDKVKQISIIEDSFGVGRVL